MKKMVLKLPPNICPQCGKSHNRGALDGWRCYRCLSCGITYTGIPVKAIPVIGCGYDNSSCNEVGWQVSTNDVEIGMQILMESFAGGCPKHGEYEGRVHFKGDHIHWFNDEGITPEIMAIYYGFGSVEEFNRFGKIKLS